MKLIKPKVEILDKIDGQAILERIEQIARTCYKSEPKYIRESIDYSRWVWEDSEEFKALKEDGATEYPIRYSSTADKLVKRLIESKHEAMLEFVDITVKFTCDRGVSHELVRHRMASFAQESTRYCNYSKDKFNNELTFIIPSWLDTPEGQYKWEDQNPLLTAGASIEEAGYDDSADLWIKDDTRDGYVEYKRHYKNWMETERFMQSLQAAEDSYLELIEHGWKAQQARMVLPMSIKTEINMKANLREWRHFFKLRCHSTAHPDIRVLALDLLKQMHEQIPVIFDDLYDTYFNNGDK